jgi:anaerobic magnesium-protoporphyrin IX monomethyl ester cyclase
LIVAGPFVKTVLFIYKYEYLEPLGLMTLASVLESQGHRCEFLDLAFERDVSREVRRIRPDVIAYSITTGRHSFYQQLNLALKKECNFISMFGGPHATFFPDFIQEEGVDVLCRGEGEGAILDLANALDSGAEIHSIPNLWVKSGGEIHKNPVRPLISDLDTLPFVSRNLVNKYEHYRRLHRRMVLTGRGCPYRCTYCFNHSYNDFYKGNGRIVRKRSVGHVISELQAVREQNHPRRFQFVDDTFILDHEWCMEFCDRYEAEIRLPFIAYARVNLVNEEIVRRLKSAGCITILYAIESGNDRIRNEVLKRNLSREQIVGAAQLFRKHGLRTYAQNMVGLPDETMASAMDTLNLNIACKPDYSWCSIFQPYPMTDLWFYCKEKGYLTNEEFDETYYKKSILNIPHRKYVARFHHLFPVVVSMPILRFVLPVLLRLPLTWLYYLAWHVHRAYTYFRKVKWIDVGELFIREKRKT